MGVASRGGGGAGKVGARRVLRYVLRMRKRFLFACQLRISIHTDTQTRTHRHIRIHMFKCVRRGLEKGGAAARVRGAAQTSSIQKQMEKVMIICLANAAQSGREGGSSSSSSTARREGRSSRGGEDVAGQRSCLLDVAHTPPWHI